MGIARARARVRESAAVAAWTRRGFAGQRVGSIAGVDHEIGLQKSSFFVLMLAPATSPACPVLAQRVSIVIAGNHLQLIDLFSGCGGLSEGAHEAGIATAVAVEQRAAAARTFSRNFPSAVVFNSPIEAVDPTSFAVSGDIIIAGGPPCQGFSSSNQRKRQYGASRNYLFREMIRFVDALNPEAFVFENVYGIIEGAKRQILDELLVQLRRRFAFVEWRILSANEYGIPQRRRRVFVVAKRRGRVSWPHPTQAQLTVRDAIADLPSLSVGADADRLRYRGPPVSAYARELRQNGDEVTGNIVSANAPTVVDRYKYVPQGGNWKDIPAELMKSYTDRSRCHTGIYRRLSWNEPSVVIGNYRKNMLIHPSEDRGLSVREAARLQSFPDRFLFEGSIGEQQQQVGNAVPPLLAKLVFQTAILGT